MSSAARPVCRDCRKPRPLMADGRCPHCSEIYRLAGKPKDFLPSVNDEEPTPLRRKTMTITQERPSEAPTMLPGPINGWTGRYKACRDCGMRAKPEVDDGLCTDCYAEHFGPAGLRQAEARRDDGSPAARVDRWHPEYAACLDCGTTETPYGSRGLCRKCYPKTMKVGYVGNAAPPKPSGRGVETPRPDSAPPSPVSLPHRDEASVESVAASVAYHSAQLGITPEQPAPLTPAQVAEVWTAPLPVEPDVTNSVIRQPDGAEVAVPVAAAPVEPSTIPNDPQRVPAVVASAVVAQVQAIMEAKPDLEDIPLADLLAEVNRRTENLSLRLVAAERDAARFRAIAALLRDEVGALLREAGDE